MASGTYGNIISYDASGNPVAIATGTSGHFLKSQGAGNPPVFASATSTADGFFATSGLSSKDLGQGLHIKTGDSGVSSVNYNFSQLIVEGNTTAGISIITRSTRDGGVAREDSGGHRGLSRDEHAEDAVRGREKGEKRGKGEEGKSPEGGAGRGGTQTADEIAAKNARVINAKRLEGPPTQGPQGSQQFRYNPDNVVTPTGTSLVPKGPVRDILGDASRTGSLTTQMGVPLLFGGLGTLAASSQDDSGDPIIYPLRSEGMTYGESVNDSVGGDLMGMGFFGQTNEQRKNPTFSIDQNVAENLGSPPADSNLDRQQSILDNLMVASQEEMDEARKQVVNQAAGEVINPDLSTMRNTNADREDAAKVDPVSIAAKQYADLLGGEKNDKMRNAMMLASLGAGIAKGDTAGGLQQAANVAASYQQKEIERAEKGLDRAIKRADTEAMQDLKRQEVEGRIGYYDVLKLNAQNEQTRLTQTAGLKAAETEATLRQTPTRTLAQG